MKYSTKAGRASKCSSPWNTAGRTQGLPPETFLVFLGGTILPLAFHTEDKELLSKEKAVMSRLYSKPQNTMEISKGIPWKKKSWDVRFYLCMVIRLPVVWLIPKGDNYLLFTILKGKENTLAQNQHHVTHYWFVQTPTTSFISSSFRCHSVEVW